VRLIARNIIYALLSDLHESEQLSWEIVVVNKPILNALCLPGGKIIVYYGLLDQFKNDTEITTVIACEVLYFCFEVFVSIV